MSNKPIKEKIETSSSNEQDLLWGTDASAKNKNKSKDWKPVEKSESLKRKTLDDQVDLPADNSHRPENQSAPVTSDAKGDFQVKLVFKKREMPGQSASSSSNASETAIVKTYETEMSDKAEEEEGTVASNESELPSEVDAFFKGKNKYKHPYGDWRPVIKAEPLKRITFGDQLELPDDNWYLPENQLAPVITEIKDDSHVKLVFKEREIPGLSSSSSKAGETAIFKQRKPASNRQLRGSGNKSGQKKDDVDES